MFELQNTLLDQQVSIVKRINHFKQVLEQKSMTLKQNRDGATIKFLKTVRTILFSIALPVVGFFIARKLNEATKGNEFISKVKNQW